MGAVVLVVVVVVVVEVLVSIDGSPEVIDSIKVDVEIDYFHFLVYAEVMGRNCCYCCGDGGGADCCIVLDNVLVVVVMDGLLVYIRYCQCVGATVAEEVESG